MQAVFGGDVAEACVRGLAYTSTQVKLYEPAATDIYTYKTLMNPVLEHVGKRRALVPVPFFVWDTLAALLSVLANPPLTRDQVKLMKSDNVVGETALTLEDLGMALSCMDAPGVAREKLI